MMKKYLNIVKGLVVLLVVNLNIMSSNAQSVEWRLVKDSYNSADPDGAGLALGSVLFTLEIRSVGAILLDVTQISVGYSWQSLKAMIPTAPGCAPNVTSPANITLSPAFIAAGFLYTQVSQCTPLVTVTGGQTFDRTAAGTIDNGSINIAQGPSWTRVFTVTLWALSPTAPEAGYGMLHSGEGGAPGQLTSYNVTQAFINPIVANSLSYTNPIALGPAIPAPVTFTNYDVRCNDKGALLTWTTATEENSSRFEIQKSANGTEWLTVDNVTAAGSSSDLRHYQYLDLEGGPAFYRIRQVDRDGRFIYTSIKRTDCKAGQFTVTLYPVPAKDNLTVVINSGNAVKTDLQVLDMNGKTVHRTSTMINKGNNNIMLNVSGLPGGQYLLVSSDPSIIINKKFTVIR